MLDKALKREWGRKKWLKGEKKMVKGGEKNG
jgi:hypothetical protein